MTSTAPSPDAAKLRALLDGEHVEIRDRVRMWLSMPGNAAATDLPMEEHREQVLVWARELASERDPAMGFPTEYGGQDANVQALRTTATYDRDTQEFVVHTPDDDARKDYIGSAARDGRIAAVFAQLVVAGESRGVHALLVPLRDDDGTVLEGIRIEDCGAKLGL